MAPLAAARVCNLTRPRPVRAAPLSSARRSVRVRAEEKKAEKAPWTEPTLDPSTPAPIFGGSTGGLLSKASEEEFYVITWEGYVTF